MNQELNFIYVTLLFLFLPLANLFAQDNLQVEFESPTSVPDFLNICGEPDTATVAVSLNGLSPDARMNIVATLDLFKGVELVEFIGAESSAGVALTSNADPNNPVFGLPDLSPSGTTSINITFTIAAKCEYIDTLSANNAIQVQNVWNFDYTMGGSAFQESDINTEYRDAFAVPSFTSVVNNTNSAVRSGECFSRDIVVTNSGLDGFVNEVVYTNTQGNGIFVESILVNGIPLTLTKTMLVSGDTLIEGTIDGTHFVANTVGGGAGNNDMNFDPNETVTITENICLLNCNDSRASLHDISWGCDSRFCNTISTSDFVQIGQGAANVQVEDSGTIPNISAGYCQAGSSSVTFTNNGVEIDAGFGGMLNLEAGIGFGNMFDIVDKGYTITQITISGVVVPLSGSMTMIDDNPLFASDPDGAGTGLEDLDNDGFFDDLGVGDAFEVRIDYEVDCSVSQNTADNCSNDLGTSFSARVDYDNACQERVVRLRGNYFRPNNKISDTETEGDVDAFVEQDTFYLRQRVERSMSFFEKNCNGEEEYQVLVKLPPGVNPEIGTFQLIRNNGTVPIPLLSNTISNDTLILIFDAASTAFIGGEFEVVMGFTADCTAPLDFVEFPYEFAYYCPPCDCRHLWHCDTLQGPKLHAEMPPCPPMTFVCPVGVATKSFEVNRTTFGYTDATYETDFDKNLANEKVAISCDSIEMKIVNVVGDTPLNDSLGMIVTYSNPDESMDTVQTFLFDYGTVRFTNGGNEFFCNIDQSILTTTTVDSVQTLNFDLHDCISNLGLTLVAGDTVEYLGNFTLNPDGPYPGQFMNVPNFRAFGYGMVDGVEEACDHFGEVFTVAKNQTIVNFPTSSDFPVGCEEKFLNYNLITINNGFVEWFGTEFRQAIGVDSIVIDYDPAILNSFSTFETEISVPGHPIHGNNYFSVQGFDPSDGGHYVALFDTLQYVPALNNVQSYAFSFRIRVIANCEAEMGSANDNNEYDFLPQIYFRDRYYASVIGDGSCSEQIIETQPNNIFYSDPPTLNLTTASNPNFNLAGDTAYWDLQFCNTSFVGRAGLSWFALEDANGAIEVVSMEDISDPLNVIPLTVSQYGSVGNNYYAYTNGLEVGSATATFDDICNVVRVKALVTECGTTNFNARVGWNCIAYDEANWNPELYPPCVDETLALSVNTLDPFLDANIVEQPTVDPNICDTNTIAILLRNTDLGTAYDVKTQIILPMAGTSLVPGSVEIAYPSGSSFQSVPVDPVFTTTTSRGDIYEYADFSNLNSYLDQNGFPGFDPLNPTDSNQMIIRYKFVTDCDFMSGSISYYGFQGVKNCGDSTNFESGETLPIEINGAAAGLDKIFEIKFSPNSALIPNGSGPLDVIVTNLTTTATDTADLVSLVLPEFVVYDPNTTVSVEPGGWILPEPEIDMDGNFQTLVWELPLGLLQGDSAIFTFNVTSPDIDCAVDTLQAGLNTIQRKELTCVVSGLICEVDAITSVNNGELTDLPVRQNTLSFAINEVTSMCSGVDAETIIFNGAIMNNGIAFPAVPIDVEYYFDADASGNVNTGDPLVLTITENGPIAANSILTINHTIPVPNDQVCGIIVRIDSAGLDICEIAEIPLGEPQLLNAGDDQLFCATMPTTITANLGDPTCGSITDYTFNWFAISPASTNDLSATNIPDPVLTVNHNAMVQDTLRYILETNRPACGGVTRDTVNIVRALGITVDPGPVVFVQPGGSTTLSPTVNGGFAPYTYNWSPTGTLDDATSATPISTPTMDTNYSVTVTSASGCTAEAIVVVQIGNAVTATVEPFDTLICAEMQVPLVAAGGTNYTWIEDANNPSTGNLSAYNIPNPIFTNGIADTTYNYQVIVMDDAFPGAADTADVVIQTLASPEVMISSNSTTFICNGDEIALTASGADTYVWENITANTQIGNGPAIIVSPTIETSYLVTGTDSLGCIATDSITIGVNEAAVASIFNAPNSSCLGDSILLIGGTGVLVEWFENGASIGTGDSVTVAPMMTSTYMLTVENAIGCRDTSTVTITIDDCPCEAIDVSSVITVESSCGEAKGEALINLYNDPANYTFTWSPNIGTPDSLGNGRTDLPFGGYEVTIQNNMNPLCSETVYLLIQNYDGPNATAMTSPATCASADGTATLMPDSLNFLWADNSTDSARNDLTAGVHFVTITNPATPNCPNAIMVTVGEENPLEAIATIDQAPDCGVSNGQVTLTVTGGSGNYNFSWDSGVATGTNLPSGMHTVTITDTAGDGCELVYNFVLTDNVPAATVVITDTIETSCTGVADGEILFTINYDMAFATPADTIITNGFEEFENGSLPAGDYCMIITDANGCVAGEGCFTIESAETLELNFTVIPDCNMGGVIELEVQGGTPPYIFDWVDLPGTDDPQIRTDVPAGMYELNLTDSLNCAVNYTVEVPPCDMIMPSTFCDTIFIGQSDTFFIDTSEIQGDIVTLENFCIDSSGTEVEFFEMFGMLAVEYTGLDIGQDSACIQICNDQGICDTTYLCITVEEYLGLPMLVDDKDSVEIGQPVVVNVKANDIIFGGIDTSYILEQPLYGQATMNLDCSVTYNAGDDFCERVDSFSYVVCNPNGCDTASVCIFIACTDIVIFNAVSANGDRVNDFFHIAGILDYPNSSLKIYNRWGNLVYETIGYKNDWGGDFNGKRDLPDGTYYYLLELNDADDDRVFQGYLELYR